MSAVTPSVIISAKLKLSCIAKNLSKDKKAKQITEIFCDTLRHVSTTVSIGKIDAIFGDRKTYVIDYYDLFGQKKLEVYTALIQQAKTYEGLIQAQCKVAKKHKADQNFFGEVIYHRLLEEVSRKFEEFIETNIKSSCNLAKIDQVIDDFVSLGSNLMVISHEKSDEIKTRMAKKKTPLLSEAIRTANSSKTLSEVNRSLRKRAGYLLSQSTISRFEREMSEKAFRIFFNDISLSEVDELEQIAKDIRNFSKINSFFCVEARNSLLETIDEEARQHFYMEISRQPSNKLDKLSTMIDSSTLIGKEIKADLQDMILKKKKVFKAA